MEQSNFPSHLWLPLMQPEAPATADGLLEQGLWI